MEDLRLEKPFNATVATSSNPNIITATSTGATSVESGYEITEVTVAQSDRAASVKFFTSSFDTSKTLADLGISGEVSKDYRDKGKLILDEEKLKAMIASDLNKVAEVFNKSTSTLPADDKSTTITSYV